MGQLKALADRPKVVIESHIPAVPDELCRHFDIVRLDPEAITADAVRNADALIVRTRTRCDSALLSGSKVRFVATATIGTDHLDLRWLASNGITTVSAPGCNAPAVAQYVMSSIIRHPLFHGFHAGRAIAIVGVGHVGTIVSRWAQGINMNVLHVDPPRQRRGDPGQWWSLREAAARAEIITFHTPLTHQGSDATFHLADQNLLSSMRSDALVINAARGGIVDETALLNHIDSGHLEAPIIDCWESEPDINRELLDRAFVATPHIAGYSIEGKQRATMRVVEALCSHFGKPCPSFPPIYDPTGEGELQPKPMDITLSYNPLADTEALRQSPESFETLRNNYNLRHEICTKDVLRSFCSQFS